MTAGEALREEVRVDRDEPVDVVDVPLEQRHDDGLGFL